ncbi:MAG: CoA-binding protein [Desulfurococcales archaeon]|nr:CoA-binding protein [Desulfurococcales archaeon]
MNQRPDLEPFFNPSSIAIVGASPKKGSLGRAILDNLVSRYRGFIYPVNPKYIDELGLKWYSGIKEIPEPPELAIIAVKADFVPGILEEAGMKGSKAAIIISGGFAESGERGRQLQEEASNIARKYNIRVIGPNCIGVYNALVGLDTFFLPQDRMRRPPRGPIAIISQSGAFLASIMDWAALEGIGIAKAVNFGNKMDVDEVDMLEYFGWDDDIRVILMYIEGLKPGRGKDFIEIAKRVTSRKPVILLKGGKTSRGARAAASHTAALAGDYNVLKGALKQARILESDEVLDLFDMGKALANLRYPRGKRVVIVTNAGGPGVIMVDNLIRYGLEVPELSKELQEKLKSVFPPRVAVRNPVDLTGDASNEAYEKALTTIVESGEADIIVVIALMQPPVLKIELGDLIADIAWSHHNIPFVVVTMGSDIAKQLEERVEGRGIPVYNFPERAARAVYAIAHCSKCR